MRDVAAQVLQQEAKFQRFYELLVEWNEKMNLTAITEEQEVFHKHFVDSLLVSACSEWDTVTKDGGPIADVGTGAGFPGLPLAICHPGVSFVLFDSLQKRLGFVRHVCEELGLENVEAVHGRAEDLGRNPAYRNRFGGVVSRAVARLNVLLELTMPFTQQGGYLFSYKGRSVEEELTEGVRAAEKLGARFVRMDKHVLENDMGERAIAVFRQEKPTPKAYPRKAGTPQKLPLI